MIRLKIQGKQVENVPRNIFRSGLILKYKGFSSTLQYNYTGEVYTDAANTMDPNETFTTGQLDAYSLLDLNMAYQHNEIYHFRTRINNLTDAMYATRRAGRYPGPGILPGTGRTMYLSLAIRI